MVCRSIILIHAQAHRTYTQLGMDSFLQKLGLYIDVVIRFKAISTSISFAVLQLQVSM